jgi:hypothetical protein
MALSTAIPGHVPLFTGPIFAKADEKSLGPNLRSASHRGARS